MVFSHRKLAVEKVKTGWVRTENGWEPRDQRTQQILFQIRAGRPFKEIAEQFGVNISRISQIRHRAGIARRRQPQESI